MQRAWAAPQREYAVLQPGSSLLSTAATARPRAGRTAWPLFDLQRRLGNRAVRGLIQRAVTRGTDQVVQDRNLAEAILSGGANGITPPLVNGTEMPILHGTAAATERALRKPSISTSRANLLSGPYRARVTAVGNNTVSGRAYIPRNPPWVVPGADATRVAMVGLGGGMLGDNVGTGSVDALDQRTTTKFTARGNAGDTAFLAAIRQHELHHAADHWRAAQALLVPWDRALQDQVDSQQTHEGPSASAARAKVYEEAGGTPAEIAARLDQLWVQLDNDFHATHEGRRSELKRYAINDDASDVIGWYDY